MLIITSIVMLITGIITGCCLHKFYENGWIPKKYEKSDADGPPPVPEEKSRYLKLNTQKVRLRIVKPGLV